MPAPLGMGTLAVLPMASIIRRSVLASFLLALTMGLLTGSASASGQAVLADYADNGQLSQCYSRADYAAALTQVRPDQQQYGAAVDVIQQAQIECAGKAAGTTAVAATAGAQANEVSGRAVLADYEDNGQINGCYTLAQYEDALKLIRPDQQQYGAAVDVIRQAELTNLRRPGGACASAASATTVAVQDDSGLPAAVWIIIVLAGLAIVGAVAWLIFGRRGE